KLSRGVDDECKTHELAEAAVRAGPSRLAIHARTKRDGYTPPAYCEKIPPFNKYKNFSVGANSDNWKVEDAIIWHNNSHCQDLLL
ncbi:tRNA-dihydrouridine synthase, partial [Pseudoalteromonas sp. S1649]|uniref:tRNA-dihydrouridine synthase n=1 Tax=Pseudoalteromonas sp. S1649 TaxID=579508 RepID=UPI001289BBA3